MRKSLTKKEIVKKKSEIDVIFRTGKVYSAPNLRLRVAPNNLGMNRVIVIPVRKYGNSVQRNRIRRQIKEIWRLEKENLLPGFDFAFIVYSGMAISHEQQKQQLIRLFTLAHLYSR